MSARQYYFRIFWFCAYCACLSFTSWVVIILWEIFDGNPTVTTLKSSTYPVNQIPFPGISICNVNKISKIRANLLAKTIANKAHRDSALILQYIHFLGQLYDYDFDGNVIDQLLDFQNILDATGYSIKEVLEELATPCEELLWKCSLQEKAVNCSKIFKTMFTQDGYCCIFNYLNGRRTNMFAVPTFSWLPLLISKIFRNEEEYYTKSFKTESGIENGVRVTINNNIEDYFYTTLSVFGVMIHVFIPSTFPDKATGRVTDIVTQPNTEHFIEIMPSRIQSFQEILRYAAPKRNCLFGAEKRTRFKNSYSSGDCLIDCRLDSVEALCQCTPVQLATKNSSVCTLAELRCLNKNKEKWFTYYPKNINNPEDSFLLRKEKQESLHCEENCYPSCEEILYNVHNVYLQDTVYKWFEILSNFGGIFSLFLGWSIIFATFLLLTFIKFCLNILLK